MYLPFLGEVLTVLGDVLTVQLPLGDVLTVQLPLGDVLLAAALVVISAEVHVPDVGQHGELVMLAAVPRWYRHTLGGRRLLLPHPADGVERMDGRSEGVQLHGQCTVHTDRRTDGRTDICYVKCRPR